MQSAAPQTAAKPRPPKRPAFPRRIYNYIRRISDAYATHQCSLMACACAYCALLSLIPLLVVGISLLGYFMGGSERALHQVLTAIRGYVPVDAGLLKDLLAHVLMDRGLIGLFGLLGLLYAAHQAFLAMEPAMNMIWVVPENRHWLLQRLIAIGCTLYALVMLAADLAATALVAYLSAFPLPPAWGRWSAFTSRAALALIPVALTTLLFALLYRVIPAKKVPTKAAFLGAVVAATLWQITKIGFGFFLIYAHSYNRLYGSLSGLVILVVWMFYSMGILFLGAEVAADYESLQRGAAAAEAHAHSGADLGAASHGP